MSFLGKTREIHWEVIPPWEEVEPGSDVSSNLRFWRRNAKHGNKNVLWKFILVKKTVCFPPYQVLILTRHGLTGLIKTPSTSAEQSALAVHRQKGIRQVRFTFLIVNETLKVCRIIKLVMFLNVCMGGRWDIRELLAINIWETETRERLGGRAGQLNRG